MSKRAVKVFQCFVDVVVIVTIRIDVDATSRAAIVAAICSANLEDVTVVEPRQNIIIRPCL